MQNHFLIEENITQYLEDCLVNGFSSRTVECYRSSLKVWNSFLLSQGITYFSQVTRETLISYRHYLQAGYRSRWDKPISAATQAQKLAALRSFLDYCVANGKMLENGREQLRDPKLPKSLPKGILTKQQVKKLLRLPDTTSLIGFRDRVILEIFYSTGMRRQELANLKIEECYLNERRLFIREGKGSCDRWVPIGKKVRDILREYIEDVRPQLMHRHSHNTLIVGDKGGSIYPRRIQEIVRSYSRQLGVPFGCHALRHTCATHMLKGKANIRVIQSLLGHRSLATTQLYTHIDISDMARAIEKSHPRENMLCDKL